MRVVPDVARRGDPETGFLIDLRRRPVRAIGGTSLACPVFAGIQALASQGRLFPIGFANPVLYPGLTASLPRRARPDQRVAMITSLGRQLADDGPGQSLTATKGYDDTTGLGTPNGPALLLGERLLH